MTAPPQPHTHWPKSWGYVDFKMATNENALTQPKFEKLLEKYELFSTGTLTSKDFLKIKI